MALLARFPAPGWPSLAAILLALGVAVAEGRVSRRPDPPRSPVVVYLANETRPGPAGAEAFATVERWLAESGDPLALEAAASLSADRAEFPAVVDAEVAALEVSAAPRLFVATSATLRQGAALVRDARGPLRALPLDLPAPTGDYVVDESPLATVEGLRRVLRAAGALFPPAENEHVVLLVSHGCADRAVIPRLTVRPELTSAEELLSRLHDDGPPPDDGLTRAQLFGVVDELGLDVRLLAIESCEGGLGLTAAELPPSVAAVVAAPGPTAYGGFDLSVLGSDPAAELTAQARQRGDVGVLTRPSGPRPLALLPLVVAACVLVRLRRRGGPGGS